MSVLCGQPYAFDFPFERAAIRLFDNSLYCFLEGGIVLLMSQLGSLTLGICKLQPLTILILERINGYVNSSFWIERWLFTRPWIAWVSPSIRRIRLALYRVHDFVRFASQSND